MPQVKPDVETYARVKVVGVGGSGSNAVDHMIRSKVKGVDFIGLNTDAQDLHHSLMPKKLHIGRNVTRGLGTGMDPELGRLAAEENRAEIQELLKGSDMVFITCGFGGGTGSGAGPVVASAAKEAGILTIAVVTKPFSFEGSKRAQIAEECFSYLDAPIKRVGAKECAVPYSKVLEEAVLPQAQEIEKALRELAQF